MILQRLQAITAHYPQRRIAVVGDFCLDRYLEIDPAKKEVSLETGLPVYNVINIRAQPGGAGTILNNLSALGIGAIHVIGFHGIDGEGFELRQALAATPGVQLDHFLQTPLRRTFTYCKPLIFEPGQPPRELNRLDSKNWTPTPKPLETELVNALVNLAARVDAIILLSQVDLPETGVITSGLLQSVARLAGANPRLLILADSRTGLRNYPSVCLKMNRAEFQRLIGAQLELPLPQLAGEISKMARHHGRMIFVTLGEQGLLGATPDGTVEHVPALPVRGEIDIVGAGDAVTANLTAALTSGATLREALELANTAASIVVHQLGTTGTASVPQITALQRMASTNA